MPKNDFKQSKIYLGEYPLLTTSQYPRNPIRFREQRRIDNRECYGWQGSRNKTRSERRLCENSKRHHVACHNTAQNNVGQLTCG